jgi:aryl-alcohol dehydrogenase-like predicted oxidoreductase
MQYNRLGDTGLIVSRLAFGAMTFGSARGTVFEDIEGRSKPRQQPCSKVD